MHTVKFALRSDYSTFIIFGNVDYISYSDEDCNAHWHHAYIIYIDDEAREILSADIWVMIEVW